MKKIKTGGEKEGMPLTAFREIKLLKTLNHPNIVQLLSVVVTDEEIAVAEPPTKRPFPQPSLPTAVPSSSSSSSSSAGVVVAHPIHPTARKHPEATTSSSSSALSILPETERRREPKTAMAVYLVFEYIEHDLSSLMEFKKSKWSPSEIKQLMIVCHHTSLSHP